MTLIYLEWADTIGCGNSWIPKSELNEWIDDSEWIIKTIGWVLREDDKFIVLAHQIKPADSFTEEQYGHIQKIPKTWIRKREIINLGGMADFNAKAS